MYSINRNVVYREVDDRIVLINLDSGYYYSLNEVGRLIFRCIVDKKDIDNIIDKILNEYEITREKARNDIDSFLSELTKENILKEE